MVQPRGRMNRNMMDAHTHNPFDYDYMNYSDSMNFNDPMQDMDMNFVNRQRGLPVMGSDMGMFTRGGSRGGGG